MHQEVQLLCRFEEVWQENEEVNEYFITRSFDLEILEKHIDPKNFKSLINDILSWNSLKTLTSRTLEFSSNLKDR